jgi:hypothetical protein
MNYIKQETVNNIQNKKIIIINNNKEIIIPKSEYTPKSEYSLKRNFFDTITNSPPNDFMLKLKMRVYAYETSHNKHDSLVIK